MEWLTSVNWEKIFALDTPLLEIIVRGSVVYLTLFMMLRMIIKRQAGSVGISDLLVIVLIADASQNAMAGEYTSIADGMVLVSTLIFWNVLLDWLGYRFPAFDKLISPPPLPLIKHGRMLRKNMEKELITESDLLSQLRLQGIDELHKVKQACMESDGKISVVPYEK